MSKTSPLLALCILALMLPSALNAGVDFTKEVRPILAKYCFKCHGIDEGSRKGGLRLDVRDNALQSGDSGSPAITPGAPEKSELVRRILSNDDDELMPPPSAKHALSGPQIETIVRWVREGAPFQAHWAFMPPTDHSPPPFNPSIHLSQHPIDRFIGERLAAQGLTPSPIATKETLLRRLSLDLIGIPPSPDELANFIQDPLPDAYERAVNRLLASPQYGERWAKRWLDLARYADTNGYEKDRPRSIWPYRDWVIRAINDDMPFDRFTIEQIAGDMLPNPTRDQRIATGFHRNTMLNEEGGIDPLEFRFHAMTDRVATTGTTWLGLTLGCAQCHTHKNDPILHREYYQLMALLNNADEPDLELRDPQHDESQRKNADRATAILKSLEEKWPLPSTEWTNPEVVSVSNASGQTAKIQPDGSILLPQPAPETESTTVVLRSTATSIASIHLEVIPDEILPKRGPGRADNGNFVLTNIQVHAKPIDSPGTPERLLEIASAKASLEQERFPISAAFDQDARTGWAIDPGPKGGSLHQPRNATFSFKTPFISVHGCELKVVLHQAFGTKHVLGRFKISTPTPQTPESHLSTQRANALQFALDQWIEARAKQTAPWSPLKPASAKSNLPILTPLPDHSILASGDISKDDTYEIQFKDVPGGTTALRLEALPDPSLPAGGPGMTYYEGPKGDFFLGEFSASTEEGPLTFSGASESYSANNFGSAPVHAALALDGDSQTGWSCAKRPGMESWAIFRLAKPLPKRMNLTVRMRFGRHYACSLGRFRISATNSAQPLNAIDIPVATDSILATPHSQWSAAEKQAVLEAFLMTTPELAQETKTIRELRRPISVPTTLVLNERPTQSPRPTHLHHRGEFLQPKMLVEPDIPNLLKTASTPKIMSRLDLARWLVSSNNPLTARVTVNRHWAAFFGRGIVKSLGDFGIQGDVPSHPELLDWLAFDLQRNQWSIKHLHKLIVTSRTYQQSSAMSALMRERDPENLLLARGPRVRLDAEQIRDSLLHATGLLSSKMYGPSVYPPQPAGATDTAYGGAGWSTSQGEDRYRRSIYTFMKRSAPFAMSSTFDGPSGETCVARRETTNTPLQSLTLLNDEAFVEMARHAGQSVANSDDDDAAKITNLHLRFVSRSPSSDELSQMQSFVNLHRNRIRSREIQPESIAGKVPTKADETAVWTLLVRALMNLDETVTKN
jgi:hypothetical protein